MSTLYGSDAVAGVINIITKKGKGKPLSVYSTLSAGSYNTFRGVAGINGHANKNNYNLQYSHLEARGFSSAYDSSGGNGFDKDGFNQNVISGSFNSQLTSRLLLKLNGNAGKYNADLDYDAFKDEKDYTFSSRNYQAGSGLEYKYNKGTLILNYNYNNTERKFLDDSAFVRRDGFAKYTSQRYIGRAHFTELYTNVELSKFFTLLGGVDYRFQNTDQNYSSISGFGEYKSPRGKDSTHMNLYSVFASAFLKEMGGFHLEFGGRYNHHSEYGSNFTYTFNPSFLFKENLKVFANVASAFKAPSLYQLYVINKADNNPMGTLKPETSRTGDAGIEYSGAKNLWHARAVYFKRSTKNAIDYSFETFQYFNYNKQKDHGFELEADGRLDKLTLRANYTFITGQVNTIKYRYDAPSFSYIPTGDTSFNNLFRRPRHTVNFTLGYAPIERLYVSAHARFAGKRYEPSFMASSFEMEAYQTVDLYGEYKISSKLKAFADLKNIFNEQYFDVRGYNSRRFNFMAGLNLNF
jgi:vitamin B12 transporter